MIRKLERYYRFGVAVVILHVLVVIPHAIAHTMMHIDMVASLCAKETCRLAGKGSKTCVSTSNCAWYSLSASWFGRWLAENGFSWRCRLFLQPCF